MTILLYVIYLKCIFLQFTLFQRCVKSCPDKNAFALTGNVSDLVCDYDIDVNSLNPSYQVISVSFQPISKFIAGSKIIINVA